MATVYGYRSLPSMQLRLVVTRLVMFRLSVLARGQVAQTGPSAPISTEGGKMPGLLVILAAGLMVPPWPVD